MAPDRLSVEDGSQATESDSDENSENQPKKVSAPDFTVYDRDNNEVHLSDFVGKPVVLNFWASWCVPCQGEMPDFDEVYTELGEEVQYTLPVFYDLDGDAAATYGVYSLPTTYFIDAGGYGVAQATGAIDRETLEKGIGMITNQ